MNRRSFYLIIVILFFGAILKLYLTSDHRYIFHMDSARDYLEVREMVLFHKLRLTGPTSAIAGFYTGPGWYYLLAIPFILTGGNPYSSIVLEIIAWVIGGFFLLIMLKQWGRFVILLTGLLWLFSDYMMLQTSYSFHPNMITLLTPLFIYCLNRFIHNPSYLLSIITFTLAAAFFQFEMNFGVFVLPLIFLSILGLKKIKLLYSKQLWSGVTLFLLSLLPQILFDFKYNHMMFYALQNFITNPNKSSTLQIGERFSVLLQTFYNIFLPTFINIKVLTNTIIGLLIVGLLFDLWKRRYTKDSLFFISSLFIFIPLLGYLFVPVNVNPWHLGGVVSAMILLSGMLFHQLNNSSITKPILWIIAGVIIYASTINLLRFIKEHQNPSDDPSTLANELQAIDYVYQEAQGNNFNVYTYIPSVYDYPYQYLFWWHGQNKYGYLPKEYAYLPNKPQYVPGKDKLISPEKDAESGLTFLIKEPTNKKLQEEWEDNFNQLKLIKTYRLGPLIVESRVSH